MGGQHDLRAGVGDALQQVEQGEASAEGQRRLGLVQQPQPADPQALLDEREEGLAMAALVHHPADADLLVVREQGVHRLGAQEEARARGAGAAHELEMLDQRGLGPTGRMHRAGPAALRIQPERAGERLHEGGLPGAVVAGQHRDRSELEAVAEHLADRGEGRRPRRMVRGGEGVLAQLPHRQGRGVEGRARGPGLVDVVAEEAVHQLLLASALLSVALSVGSAGQAAPAGPSITRRRRAGRRSARAASDVRGPGRGRGRPRRARRTGR